MIGLQELIKERNIKISNLTKEMGLKSPTPIWKWFRGVERIPEKHIRFLTDKFDVDEYYLIKQVNDIDTYKPRGTKNEYIINGKTTTMIVESKIGGRLKVKIDTEDLELVKDLLWNGRFDRGRYYITTTLHICNIEKKDYRAMSLALTRLIMQAHDDNIRVDHKNGDSLNNRKKNLRCTNNSLNLKNRQNGANRNNKSGYRNVSKRGKWWVVQLQINGKNTVLKKFPLDQLEEAGKYAEKMRNKHYGEYAGKG